MGKGKGLNPADKARKKDKEREKKRNKEEKVMTKEIASLNDPDKILNELKEIAKVSSRIVSLCSELLTLLYASASSRAMRTTCRASASAP
jgi:hypothetical protein